MTLLSLLLFSSCGSDTEDAVELAIEAANSYLTNGDCTGAINELEDIGRQNKNGVYLRTLASAYACRAGYSTQTLFETDIGKFGTPSQLGGLATFTTSSSMDGPENQAYEDLQTAINILLYAGGLATDKDPTMSRRSLVFDSSTAGDINAMIMYLTMVQLGKYLYFYGNSDVTGLKGGGTAGNSCLVNFQNFALSGGFVDMSTVLAGLGAGGNACSALNDGSTYLGLQGALNEERLCQGLVWLNNFFHVFPTVIAAIGGSDLGSIGAIEALINTGKTQIVAAHPTAVEIVDVLSQDKCETLAESDPEALEVYFLFLIETLFE